MAERRARVAVAAAVSANTPQAVIVNVFEPALISNTYRPCHSVVVKRGSDANDLEDN